MPEDNRADPPEHPTKELPAPSPTEIAVAKLSTTLASRLDSQDTKLDKIVTASVDTNTRLDRVETRLTDAEARVDLLEGRAGSTSMAVKGTTQQNLEQSAQLAQERAAREALAAEHAETKKTVEEIEKKTDAQTVMLRTITGLLDKPLVKKIGYAAGTLLFAALTTATGYFARGNVAQPPPTIIQVAPAATQVPQ